MSYDAPVAECPVAQSAPERPAANPVMPSGVIAHLNPSDASAAVEFYKRAFGAVEASRVPGPEGKLMHVHLLINGGVLLLADYFPQCGRPFGPPQAINLFMQVDDIDAAFRRAVEAGAEPLMEPQVMFWGDKHGQVQDPFGYIWALNQSLAK